MSGILQLVNTFGPSGPFAVKNSLRLRSSANAYLSRVITLSATWTLSIWVKRGALGVTSPIFGASVSFNSNDTLTAGTLTTTAVYRDPSAWYHIVVSNSGCYVNGVSVGSTTTGVLVSPLIGSNAVNYFDGYLAELNLIDGQALTPSSFGAFDATSGVWQPTRYSGTYGTNGFYLKFSDTTSTTTLCYDYSGNSNNWTPNNISLTAGSTYDSMLDSPTNYDNGGNGVGNYAVLNPLNNPGGSSIVNGNLGVTTASTGNGRVVGSIAISSGKWYWEITPTNLATNCLIGIASSTESTSAYPGSTATSYGYADTTGQKFNNGSGSAYGATYVANDVIGVALDLDSGTLVFYKNGTSQGTAFSGLSGSYVAALSDGGTGTSVFVANFGQRPFAYTPPTGYKALNTQNLPAPSIQNGANFMAATLYTGNGATQNIINANNSVSFQPDFVWVKGRSTATQDHTLIDSVRGISRRIRSNTTQAEVLESGFNVTAFNANGFTVVDDAAGDYNVNGAVGGTYSGAAQYVGWQWKAGGTAVTNTAGSITSSVSANTTSGFSVVTFTAQSSGTGTVGHGLGVAPSMIILKQRAQVGSWGTYHISLGNTQRLLLNTTDAAVTTSTYWNNTSPTSSVFTIGTGFATAGDMVAYCFAAIPGYSAFGSYTGNGSANGPFVYCGFRPRYLMIKRTDSTGAWEIYDTSRSPYNVTGAKDLQADSSAAEGASGISLGYDILSNGFKNRDTTTYLNASGGTYVYAAFAENPFKYSLAR